MLKFFVMVLVFVCLCEAAISSLQLVVPSDSYSVLTGGKSSTNSLTNTIPSLSNAISEEDNKSSQALSEESNESAANSANSSADSAPSAPPTTNASAAPGPAPAAVTRVKQLPSALSSITSTAGLSRGSLLISSSALASATSGSSSGSLTSPVSSVRSSTTIQHRILPAESIPLPITISTRPGLRTVIAPETLTIQQPGIAKVGEVIQQIPTAVSHQRQTVVHNHARIVTPIVAPAVRTVTSQIVRAYHTPLVYAPHLVEN